MIRAMLLIILLAACSGGGIVDSGSVPPAGTMWFGSSFDTQSFEVRGRTSSVGTQEAFAGVASLERVIDGSQLAMRIYLGNQLVTSTDANADGDGDVWGWTLGPLFEPGVWRYEVVDLGGNVLATGTVTAAGP